MIKLNYKATYKYSGQDIGDPAAPDITYECWIHRPDGWTSMMKEFFEGQGQNVDLALDIVGVSLVAVYQGDQRYDIGNRENAVALRDSIEEQNPGVGDGFIRRLVVSIYDQQVKVEDERLGNSATPSKASRNGKAREKSPSAAKSG